MLIANGGYAAAIRGAVPGYGLDVVASEAAASNIIILDPAAVFYSDGGLEVEYSSQAMLEMADPATNPRRRRSSSRVSGKRISSAFGSRGL